MSKALIEKAFEKWLNNRTHKDSWTYEMLQNGFIAGATWQEVK